MFRPTRVSPALLLLALLFFAAAESRADTIGVTGGNFTASYIAGKWRSNSYDIHWGENSSIRGGVTDQSFSAPRAQCGSAPCAPGSDASVTMISGLPNEIPGSFFIPGTLPEGPSFLYSVGGRFDGSSLSFASGAFVFPDGPPTDTGLVSVVTRFTMSGTILVQNIAPDFQRTQVFAGDFIGSGTATFTFGYISPFIHTLELKSVNYQFQPTPEPATLILLGSGVAGLAARQRRRSRLRKLQKSVS